MIEPKEIHGKIIRILQEKGPSLPINLAKQIGMDSLFMSAFLSELANEKRIKVSHLKVGGSPLYFLEGQEKQLEDFSKFLHPKEAEAFLLLKQNKVLRDSEQEPSIRVALRSIRDFAAGFKKDDEIFWRHVLVPESEAIDLLTPKPKKIKESVQIEKPIAVIRKIKKTSHEDFQNPLVMPSQKKQKQKSDFVIKTIDFLNKNNLKILEEREFKAKEYNCMVRVKSELGPIDFLTQAKDKKTISETDLKKLLSSAQKIPLSAFFLYTKDLSKKAKQYLEKYPSVLKAIKIPE